MRLPVFPELPLAAHELPKLEHWRQRTWPLYRIAPCVARLRWLRQRDWRLADEALEICHEYRRRYDRIRKEYERLRQMLNESKALAPSEELTSLHALLTVAPFVCHNMKLSYQTMAYCLGTLAPPRNPHCRAAAEELRDVIRAALRTTGHPGGT